MEYMRPSEWTRKEFPDCAVTHRSHAKVGRRARC